MIRTTVRSYRTFPLPEMQVDHVHVVRSVTHRWTLLQDSHFVPRSNKIPTLDSEVNEGNK